MRSGVEFVALSILEALQNTGYEITLITPNPPNIRKLNGYFDTNVEESTLTIKTIAPSIQILDSLPSNRGTLLRRALLGRSLRRFCNEYDLIISTINEFPLPEPNSSIQYIHYPNFSRPKKLDSTGQDELSYTMYDKLCEIVSGYSIEAIQNQFLITNSQWMANIIRKEYDTDISVIYPPVDTEGFENVSWGDRDQGFVTIGRIVPGKNTIEATEIIRQLRERGHNVHIHIIGPVPNSEYGERVKNIARSNDWVNLEGKVSKEELTQVVSNHKFGLHTKFDEHFGIAVAELVAGGTIPFVPDDGGVREIVNCRNDITYHTFDDAVDTIERVLINEEKQNFISQTLPNVETTFGRDRFKREIIEAVNTVL
jgi:glycosyltransferase involved in cell wall biosynthesis